MDISINDLELQIDGYNLLRADRNRHGGGVACYIKNNISFEIKKYFPPDIENLFVDIVFPNSEPFTVNFLEILNEHFDQINSENKELYLLGDFNINILHNGKSFLEKHKDDLSELSTLLPIHRQYKEFCSYNSLKQLITSPTRISCHSSTLIDHILTNTPQKIVQSEINI